jgi:hypothetical protein
MCEGGGVLLRWKPKPSPLPQDADSLPKQAGLGKVANPHVAVGP